MCSGKVKSRGTEGSGFESCSVTFLFFLLSFRVFVCFVCLFGLLLIVVVVFSIYTFNSKDSIFMDKQSEFLSFPTI